MSRTDDIKLLRAARRAATQEAIGLVEARRRTTTRIVPSGKRYQRRPKHGGWS